MRIPSRLITYSYIHAHYNTWDLSVLVFWSLTGQYRLWTRCSRVEHQSLGLQETPINCFNAEPRLTILSVITFSSGRDLMRNFLFLLWALSLSSVCSSIPLFLILSQTFSITRWIFSSKPVELSTISKYGWPTHDCRITVYHLSQQTTFCRITNYLPKSKRYRSDKIFDWDFRQVIGPFQTWTVLCIYCTKSVNNTGFIYPFTLSYESEL